MARAATHRPEGVAARPLAAADEDLLPARSQVDAVEAPAELVADPSGVLAATMALGPSPTPMVGVMLSRGRVDLETGGQGVGRPRRLRSDRDAASRNRRHGPLDSPLAGSIRLTLRPDHWRPRQRPPIRDAVWRPPDLDLLVTSRSRDLSGSPSVAAVGRPTCAAWPLPMATGMLQNGVVWTTVFAAASIRDMVASPLLVYRHVSPVTATALGVEPTGYGRRRHASPVVPGHRALGTFTDRIRAVTIGQAGGLPTPTAAPTGPVGIERPTEMPRPARPPAPAGPSRQSPRRNDLQRQPATTGGGRAASPSRAHGCRGWPRATASRSRRGAQGRRGRGGNSADRLTAIAPVSAGSWARDGGVRVPERARVDTGARRRAGLGHAARRRSSACRPQRTAPASAGVQPLRSGCSATMCSNSAVSASCRPSARSASISASSAASGSSSRRRCLGPDEPFGEIGQDRAAP